MPKIPPEKIDHVEQRYQLFNESCFETFKRIKSGSVDMVMTDPPYGTTACKWDNVIPLEPMWKELKRIVKPNAAIVLMGSQPFTSVLACSNLMMFKYVIIWKKTIPSAFTHAHNMPLKIHEDICVFSKGGTMHGNEQGYKITYNPQGLVPYNKIVDGRNRGATLKQGHPLGRESHKAELFQEFTNYPTSILEIGSQGKTVHPTQKPVKLMEYLIMTYSHKNELVIDFAMGSGTTGVACGNLGRRFIGCDNDTTHGYFEIAEKRIREAYRQGEG